MTSQTTNTNTNTNTLTLNFGDCEICRETLHARDEHEGHTVCGYCRAKSPTQHLAERMAEGAWSRPWYGNRVAQALRNGRQVDVDHAELWIYGEGEANVNTAPFVAHVRHERKCYAYTGADVTWLYLDVTHRPTGANIQLRMNADQVHALAAMLRAAVAELAI